MQNKPNFKIGKMNARPFMTKDYENDRASGVQENKPNSKPKQSQTNPIARGGLNERKLILNKGLRKY